MAEAWVLERGGYIAPQLEIRYTPEAGKYVVAREAIPKNTRLIYLPRKALINRQTLPATSLTTHQLLAQYIATTTETWIKDLPPPDAFNGMPVTWSPEEIAELPLRYRNRIKEQQAEIAAGFKAVGGSFPRFQWAWLCVNSRCLWWEAGGMSLAPFIDFLNHTPVIADSVNVSTQVGMTISANQDYNPGDEIFLSYGAHENGFLLCEYGFVLSTPPLHEFLDITSEIIPLVRKHRELLERVGYWDDYTLHEDGPNFRTMVALAATQDQGRRFQQLVDGYGGYDAFEPVSMAVVEMICRELRQVYIRVPQREETATIYRGYLNIIDSILNKKHP